MLAISNVQTQNDYTRALTLEDDEARLLTYIVANASVVAKVRGARRATPAGGALGGVGSYGPDILITPEKNIVPNCSGVKFKSAVPGQPAAVIAFLLEPDDPQIGAGVPFTGILAASGGVLTQGLTELFAQATADLSVTTTTADVAGATVTAEVVGNSATYHAVAQFSFDVAAAGFGLAIGDIALDGAGVGGRAFWQDVGAASQRVTVIAQASGAIGPGSHTWKLTGVKTAAGGAVVLDRVHTTLSVTIKDA